MKIKIFAILALFLLTTAITHSQELVDWEVKVYYDLVQKGTSLPDDAIDMDYYRIYHIIANKHDITLGMVRNIALRAQEALTSQEQKIFNELEERLEPLDESADQERKIIWQKMRDKYNLSQDVLEDIAFRGLKLSQDESQQKE